MQPRPYQQAALDALHRHICEKETNPCVVIPTGGGKSALIGWAIQRWKETCPWFRCIILAHRKELIEQNADELRGFLPGGDIGLFSAALDRRDYDSSILFASIDSVYRRAGEFAAAISTRFPRIGLRTFSCLVRQQPIESGGYDRSYVEAGIPGHR